METALAAAIWRRIDQIKLEKDKLVIHRPAPEFKINPRHSEFDERLASYRRDIPRYHRYIEMMCRLLDVKEGRRVLNVGAGIGFTLYELASLGVDCYDLDICPGDPHFVNGMAQFFYFRKPKCSTVFGHLCRFL